MLNPKNLQPGNEQHEKYTCRVTKKRRVQYDYRDTDGTLFSCVGASLDACRKARDGWVKERRERGSSCHA